jgi:hypothetical protein
VNWYEQKFGVALLSIALAIIGCSQGNAIRTVSVGGKVTYKGHPVEGATISFIPDGEARPATAISGAGGAYHLMTLDQPGAMPGPYTVVVRKSDIAPESTRPVSMEDAVRMNSRPPPPPKELLPAKYADAAKSPLKFKVKTGQPNTLDLQLAD